MAPVPPAGGLSDAGATGGSGLLAGGSARQRIGTSAEDRAADHLEAAGLRLLVRNYRCRMGELDLVALDGDVLVVAEVRMRGSRRFGGAAASITWRKRARIVRATHLLLAREPSLRHLRVRFDAMVIDGAGADIEWIKGAFDAR